MWPSTSAWRRFVALATRISPQTALQAINNIPDPEIQALLINDGAILQVSPSPEDMKTFVASEIDRWGAVVTKAGIAGSE